MVTGQKKFKKMGQVFELAQSKKKKKKNPSYFHLLPNRKKPNSSRRTDAALLHLD